MIGIYVLYGPAGVYVGESVNCLRRRELFTQLGLDWGIVRELPPGTTKAERRQLETEIADLWASRGWTVISRNTSGHIELRRRAEFWRSPERRAKISAAKRKPRGPQSPQWRANISAAKRGCKRSARGTFAATEAAGV